MPNIAAAFVIPSAFSRACWEMNAVLQDWLSACSIVPFRSPAPARDARA